MLEGIIFMPTSTGQTRYELTETEPESREYTLRIPESMATVYARAQLRDDVVPYGGLVASICERLPRGPLQFQVLLADRSQGDAWVCCVVLQKIPLPLGGVTFQSETRFLFLFPLPIPILVIKFAVPFAGLLVFV